MSTDWQKTAELVIETSLLPAAKVLELAGTNGEGDISGYQRSLNKGQKVLLELAKDMRDKEPAKLTLEVAEEIAAQNRGRVEG